MPRRRSHHQEEPEPVLDENERTRTSATLVRPKEKQDDQPMSDYIRYFERVKSANQWDDSEAGRIFAAMLGPADHTLDAFDGQWESFQDLKHLLLEKIKPLRESKLTELVRLKRKEGEEVSTLKNRAIRLVAEAYSEFPQDIQAQLARDHFLHALSDKTRIQVMAAKPVTLEDTVNMAQACILLVEQEPLELYEIGSKEGKIRQRFPENRTMNKRNFPPARPTNMNKFNNRRPNVQCYRCQGFGHIQTFCPSSDVNPRTAAAALETDHQEAEN